MKRLAALAEAAEQALADEAGSGPEQGVVGVTRGAFEHRLARAPGDADAAARLAAHLPPGRLLRDTLAEAARSPLLRPDEVPDPELAAMLAPGPAAARYAALEAVGPLRLGALASLRLRVYRDAADAEALARLREQLQTAWDHPATPEDLPLVVRQAVGYRITGRLARWLAELDRGLAWLQARGARQPAAELALAAAVGDPVRAARLVDDGRQRCEAILRTADLDRYAAALAAACTGLEPLLLLRRLSPDDPRVEQTADRLEALLGETPSWTDRGAGQLAAGLVKLRLAEGRLAAALALRDSRAWLPSHRREADCAIALARLTERSLTLDEVAAEADDDLLEMVLADPGAGPVVARWEAAGRLSDADRRAGLRLLLLEELLAAGDEATAADLWPGRAALTDEALQPVTSFRLAVMGARLGDAAGWDADLPGWQGPWQQARAVIEAGAGTAPWPTRYGARCLAQVARGELVAALPDGVRAPGPLVGFPPPLVAWSHAVRREAAERWGRLVALGWSAALANPTRALVVEPLAVLPAARLGDGVHALLVARAESYRQSLMAAVSRAIDEVRQGTADGPRSRPR